MNPLELRRLRVLVNEAETAYINEVQFGGNRPERLAFLDERIKTARQNLRDVTRPRWLDRMAKDLTGPGPDAA